MVFTDRKEAGQRLAEKLISTHKHIRKPVVYALPRGGVIVAAEIAKQLKAPLDLVITRKIGHPYNPEYAICAIGEYGHPVCNQNEIANINPEWLKEQMLLERQEIKRRRETYTGDRPITSPKNKTAILVDDGIATGLTMQAAINDLKELGAKRIILAVPVAPADTLARLAQEVDEVVALTAPAFFRGAVGSYYQNFDQVEDDEVIATLTEVNRHKK